MRRSIVGPTLAALAVAATVTLLFPDSADAQRRRRNSEAGRGSFQVGYMWLDADELNESLVDAGYPEMDDRFLTLGGSGMGGAGRVLLGAEGHALLPDEEATADGSRHVALTGGYGLLRLGYLALTDGGFDVYPMVGFGGGGMNMRITERSSPTFDDVLADPARSSSLVTGGILLDAGLGMAYRMRMGDRRGDDTGGLHFGVQGGYTWAPSEWSWDLDALNDVAGGPDLWIDGFYLRATVGGWGRDRD